MDPNKKANPQIRSGVVFSRSFKIGTQLIIFGFLLYGTINYGLESLRNYENDQEKLNKNSTQKQSRISTKLLNFMQNFKQGFLGQDAKNTSK